MRTTDQGVVRPLTPCPGAKRFGGEYKGARDPKLNDLHDLRKVIVPFQSVPVQCEPHNICGKVRSGDNKNYN